MNGVSPVWFGNTVNPLPSYPASCYVCWRKYFDTTFRPLKDNSGVSDFTFTVSAPTELSRLEIKSISVDYMKGDGGQLDITFSENVTFIPNGKVQVYKVGIDASSSLHDSTTLISDVLFNTTNCTWNTNNTSWSCPNIFCEGDKCTIYGSFEFISVLYLYTDSFMSNITGKHLFGLNGSVSVAYKHYFSG